MNASELAAITQSCWKTIECAERRLGAPCLLARFRPGAVWPDYVVMATWTTWATLRPGAGDSCESFGGWHTEAVPLMAPAKSRTRIICERGVLPDDTEWAPTHWMAIPEGSGT